MKKILIVGGHRQGDPGAVHGKWNETTLYDQLYPVLVKYAKLLKNAKVDFYNLGLNMYTETQKGRGAHSVKGKYDYVLEVHWDAGIVGKNTGGHIIVGSSPDATDKRVAKVIGDYIGWSRTDGVSIRRNLLNLNVFYPTKTSYCLVEMGYVTNSKDVDAFLKNKEGIGKGLIEAVAGETIGQSTAVESPKTEVKPTAPSKPVSKTIDQLADEVIAGKHGTGDACKKALGSQYDAVQKRVNEKLGATVKPKAPAKKSNDTIAQEVINSQWGNGTDRTNRLKKAGYNPTTIQNLVNQKLGVKTAAKPKVTKKTNAQIAREIYNGVGNWGTGQTRIDRLRKAGYDPVAVQREVNKLF
ncbi:N-acetylmuramoyl-L-alanine amidase [Enterococcus olivae]